ncbi:hypothetical protein RRG08_001991 [Elysia crispata]|uniref:Uncharacterized protein n=1 Tax=Elysia crispata TaxID=231223 RepID=A0AAE1BB04_9GAST|nr:hypothetical protein RRG08_001991 [Elysia crispata]
MIFSDILMSSTKVGYSRQQYLKEITRPGWYNTGTPLSVSALYLEELCSRFLCFRNLLNVIEAKGRVSRDGAKFAVWKQIQPWKNGVSAKTNLCSL